MVLEEFIVIVRGQNGRGKRQFTYYIDPHKKPNAESVLRDFRLDSRIEDERNWHLCTLTGKEIRWLTDYADRVLVLEPNTNGSATASSEAILPRLGAQSPKLMVRNQAASSNYELANAGSTPVIVSTTIIEAESRDRATHQRARHHHRSESSSIVSMSSTPKLPSLSTSSSSGSNLLSSYGSGAKRNKVSEQRLSRVSGVLPKTDDSRPGYAERDNRHGKSGRVGKRRERSR